MICARGAPGRGGPPSCALPETEEPAHTSAKSAARATARQAQCLSQLKQFGITKREPEVGLAFDGRYVPAPGRD